WEKAKTDTLGVQNYYEKHKQNYVWNTRVKTLLGSTTDKSAAELAVQMLKEGKSKEQVAEALNNDEKIVISFTEGLYEIGHPALPKGFNAVTGVALYASENNFVIVNVEEVFLPENKKFEEVKGRVTGDYQLELEEKWMEQLRKKYQIVYNKKALKKL